MQETFHCLLLVRLAGTCLLTSAFVSPLRTKVQCSDTYFQLVLVLQLSLPLLLTMTQPVNLYRAPQGWTANSHLTLFPTSREQHPLSPDSLFNSLRLSKTPFKVHWMYFSDFSLNSWVDSLLLFIWLTSVWLLQELYLSLALNRESPLGS